jgi:hypothetical protein
VPPLATFPTSALETDDFPCLSSFSERFRRPCGLEQSADGFGGTGISMQVAADVRIRVPLSKTETGSGVTALRPVRAWPRSATS